MSEIYVDSDCKVCSAYGDWINKKNNELSLKNQKNLSENEILLDTLVFKNEEKVYYFSDAVIITESTPNESEIVSILFLILIFS